ncbi:hypothetical protein SK128_007624 [Halocaridina rubra]|uniref:Uncharacterized protein n=1 Tax=Halocaridina rubra TaxID=373956 RepID=A0AAN8X4U1_HALRR
MRICSTCPEGTIMEEELICAVCAEGYGAGSREPVVLPHCGHTFCRLCLFNVENTGRLDCPTCRKSHTGTAVGKLPINFALLSLSETRRRTESSVCSVHGSPAELWCQDCQEALCAHCILEGHLTDGHDVKAAKVVVEEKKQGIRNQGNRLYIHLNEGKKKLLEEMRDWLVQLSKTCEDSRNLSNSTQNLDKILEDTEHSCTMKNVLQCEELVESLHLEIMEKPILKTADATSVVRGEAERLQFDSLQWPLKVCALATDGRRSKIRYEYKRLHMYALSEQKEDAHFIIQFSAMQLLIPDENPEIFMDLATTSRHLGRVYISLWGYLRRAQHFLALCTGTLGPSYRGSKFNNVMDKNGPGENIFCRNYMYKHRPCSKGLMDNLEWDGEHERIEQEGFVSAWSGGKSEAEAYFGICTREKQNKKVACPFGKVIRGLEIVREAVRHEPVTDVTITDAGVVIPH